MRAQLGERGSHGPGDVFGNAQTGLHRTRLTNQIPGIHHAIGPGVPVAPIRVAIVAMRPGGMAGDLGPGAGMADRMLVIGTDVVRVGIGMHTVDIRLVPRSGQRQSIVLTPAGAGELQEETVRQIVLVVPPISIPFAVPVAVVEVTILSRLLLLGHVAL